MYSKKSLALYALVFILSFSFTGSFAVTPQAIGIGAASLIPAPEIIAPSAILVEAESGQILYSKDINKALHISAACKLMTVLVAIENADLTSYVTVSSESVGAEGSVLNLGVGAKYPLEDLLYAVMLTFANDAAKAVAEHVSAGDINKFVDKMNAAASKLNMTRTHFTNPTGLFDENQFTTASDIALMIKYAIGNAAFNKIYSTKVRPWYNSGNYAKILTSSNNLSWGYDGFEGGKIGYNKKDQQTIISTAVRMNMKLISIVLESPEATMYADTTALFDYGFQNFRKDTLVSKGEVLKTVELDGEEINLVSQTDIMYVHPLGESYIKEFNAIADLKPPIKKTVPAGSAIYILQDGTSVSISLFPETEIIPPEDFKTTVRKKFFENKDIFYLVLLLIAIEVVLLVFYIGKLAKKLVLFLIRRFGHHRS